HLSSVLSLDLVRSPLPGIQKSTVDQHAQIFAVDPQLAADFVFGLFIKENSRKKLAVLFVELVHDGLNRPFHLGVLYSIFGGLAMVGQFWEFLTVFVEASLHAPPVFLDHVFADTVDV